MYKPKINKGLFKLVVIVLVVLFGIFLVFLNVKSYKSVPSGESYPEIEGFTSTNSIDDYLKNTGSKKYILWLGASEDNSKRRLFIKSLDIEAKASVLPIYCDRIHMSKKSGICIKSTESHINTASFILKKDSQLDAIAITPGIPNRARISKDGKYAAFTSFTSGDSYDSLNFSTRTYIVDVENSKVMSNLEDYKLIKDGEEISPVSRNYWGVTFLEDSNNFFATVKYDDAPYMVFGDIKAEKVTIVGSGIECPSISSDGKKIVYKKKFTNSVWRLNMLDISTRFTVELADKLNVDDQAEWLDDNSVLFARFNEEQKSSHIFKLSTENNGSSEIFIENAYSPAVVSNITN